MSDFGPVDGRLEAIRHALSRTQEQLLELPEDAFDARLDLRQRQLELRAEASRLAATSRSAESKTSMRDRLQRLRHELDSRMNGRISHTAAAQTGQGGGIDPMLVHELNRRIDEATGVDDLRKEIRDLERRLAEIPPDVT